MSDLQPAPPQVLCESTGAARPWPLIEALSQDDRYCLRHFVVTVDALNLHRDFDDGRVLIGESSLGEDPALRCAAEILAEQILFASVIILTKVDTVPQAVTTPKFRFCRPCSRKPPSGCRHMRGFAVPPDATRLPMSPNSKKGQYLGLPETGPQQQHRGHCHRRPTPVPPSAVVRCVPTPFGHRHFRTKGFVWLASRPAEVLLWQQSGSQISFELTSVWGAEAVHNRYGKLLPSEVELIKAQVDAAHPVFGDRQNTLTIIGLPDACNTFAFALKSAFCTEQEVQAWQRGEDFDDPWPKTLRAMG